MHLSYKSFGIGLKKTAQNRRRGEKVQKESLDGVLSDSYTKLVVMNYETGEELAVITNELITTASAEIVVKLTPNYEI